MPDAPERNEAPAAPVDAVGPDSDKPSSSLPRPIQEHLGLQLRTSYNTVTAEKPAYLGDPAVPLEFELQLQRLEASERRKIREKAHDRGVEAVAQALNIDLGPEEAGSDPEEDR
jgi:hypothetical protein